jgi:hypothetical protein
MLRRTRLGIRKATLKAIQYVSATMTIDVQRGVAPNTFIITVFSYVKPEGLTERAAEAGEVEVKLWKTPDVVTGQVIDDIDGPPIDNGGWNVVPNQPKLTDEFGVVILGDSTWGTDRIGTDLYLPDGWYRIVATHVESEAAVARRFFIADQILWNDYVSSQLQIDTGREMPPEFEQDIAGGTLTLGIERFF